MATTQYTSSFVQQYGRDERARLQEGAMPSSLDPIVQPNSSTWFNQRNSLPLGAPFCFCPSS